MISLFTALLSFIDLQRLDLMIAGPDGGPVIRYATVRGLSRLAGTEPQAWETGRMEDTRFVGLDIR